MMVGKDKKTEFDMATFGRVDDQEVLKNFDWSTFSYTHLQQFENNSTGKEGKKAFKESHIQGDDNMDIEEDESRADCNNSDTNTPTDSMIVSHLITMT
ncbi:Ulp1-like peptidase [Cucumis melo var. makuwa]|uniref:Ulp1-like peptidase n=1 Tax=Cucumis melo var. makuwa TaxID=1194695 RepID=A0A5A7V7Z4_CUCMM|nr:Ulp1-like peptidase [Cucumis melo var. makuwa]